MFTIVGINQYKSGAMAAKHVQFILEYELTEWSIIRVGLRKALVGGSNHAFTEQLISPKVNT